MAVSKAMFGDWKKHPVTEELMEDLRQNVEALVAQMVNRETPDEAKDQFVRAFVKVSGNVLSWEPEIIREEEEDA